MKMSDVRVGMRLRSSKTGALSPITVTEITERGFRYSLDAAAALIPRLGMSYSKDGHEHYGIDGEALYELDNVASAHS
jgi:hypothetical protein